MKTQLEILQRQIADQIEGRASFEVEYTDAENDRIRIYEQDNFYIKPTFCKPKIINARLVEEILSLKDEKRSTSTVTYLKTNMTYDEFFNKFYNKLS